MYQHSLRTDLTSSAQRKEVFLKAYALSQARYGTLTKFSEGEIEKYIAGEKELDDIEKSILSKYAGKYGITDLYDKMPFWDNIHKIYDADAMKTLNAAITTIRLMKLDVAPVSEMNMKYYRDIHRCLYKPLYPWAGEIRDINLTSRVEALKYVPYHFVSVENLHEELSTVFDNVQRVIDRNNIENALVTVFDELGVQKWNRMDNREKIARLVTSVGGLWRIHPFLHGNILAELYFIVRFCEEAGLPCERFVFTEYGKNNVLMRSMIIAYYDPNPLARIVTLAIERKSINMERKNQDNSNHKRSWAQVKTMIDERKEAEMRRKEAEMQARLDEAVWAQMMLTGERKEAEMRATLDEGVEANNVECGDEE